LIFGSGILEKSLDLTFFIPLNTFLELENIIFSYEEKVRYSALTGLDTTLSCHHLWAQFVKLPLAVMVGPGVWAATSRRRGRGSRWPLAELGWLLRACAASAMIAGGHG